MGQVYIIAKWRNSVSPNIFSARQLDVSTSFGGLIMAGAPLSGSINQQAASAIQGAGLGAMSEMYQPVGQIATTDLSQYQNPYTQQVINTSLNDLERQRQMQMNDIGAQAQAAKAFGGSRQAVAEALTNEAALRQGSQLSANLNQAGYQNAQQMAQQDITNRANASVNRLAAGAQLGNIANLGFGMGQTVQNNLLQQGASQQAMQQALIDAAKQQFTGYTNAPAQSLSYMSQALGSTPTPTGQTQTSSPGLFDYLTTGAAIYGALPSDVRLKKNIVKTKVIDGINVYVWDWNDKAKEIGAESNPSHGVIAQEVMEIKPEAVIVGADGYLRVDYSQLPKGVR